MSSEALTFLFTDIEGSTQLLGRVGGTTYASILSDHHALIRAQLTGFGGEEIDTAGDGFFAVFSSARRCAAAVIAMQRALQGNAWPGGESVRVRMGLHSGEAIREASGLVGMDVHRAARVAGVAHGGQVLLSETTAALVRDGLPDGAVLQDLGAHRLKDLSRPQQIFQLSTEGLLQEFPQLRSLDNPELANNLPSQPAGFIGRERELAEVAELVGRSRLVTLTGAGGAGKTRLALQVAAAQLDSFGDGVWLVELAGLGEPAEVADRVCETLGISTQPERTTLELVTDALGPQRLLLVLDNCEHLLDGCAELAAAILRRCGGVSVIATSREPLGIDGETIYRVPSLSLGSTADEVSVGAVGSDAITLFIERARAQGVALGDDDATTQAVLSVCRRLDGMPLAIELAVARLRSMSLTSLSERLDQRFRLLTGGSRTALPRQRTLEATVQWSYSLLGPSEQTLLRRLSVFVEGCDLDAAEAVCGLGDIEAWEVADLLGSLVDKSLVMTVPVSDGLRYRLLETIRQFAGDRLIEGDPVELEALGAAHCAHYVAHAATARPLLDGHDPVAAVARFDAERANLRRAMDFAAADPARAAQLIALISAMSEYWYHNDSPEIGEWLTAVSTPEARALGPAYVHARASVVGLTARSRGPEALADIEATVAAARELGDPQALHWTLAFLAGSLVHLGRVDDGRRCITESIVLARELGDDISMARSLTNAHALAMSDPDGGEELLREAIEIADRAGLATAKLTLLNNSGVQAMVSGDLPLARQRLLAAWTEPAAAGQPKLTLTESVASMHRLEGELEEAQRLFSSAVAAGRRSGNVYILAYLALGLALVASDEGRSASALAFHALAQSLLDRTGGRWPPGYTNWRAASLTTITAALGADAVQVSFARAAAMTRDAAINTLAELAAAPVDA